MAINENDSRVRRTKKLIRKGLTELAQEKSIDKITVKELTEHIDINRGTFYLHYSDIENLVESIQEEIFVSFRRILDGVTVERMMQESGEIFFEFCNFLNQNSDICAVLLASKQASAFAAETGKMLCDKCYEILSAAYPELGSDRYDLICDYFIYGGIGIIRSWLNFHPEKTPRQISELWLGLIKGGIIGILESESKEAAQK